MRYQGALGATEFSVLDEYLRDVGFGRP